MPVAQPSAPDRTAAGTRSLAARVFRFGVMTGVSVLISYGFTMVMHEWCGVEERLAFLIALVTVFCMNFVLMRYYVYTGRHAGIRRQFVTYAFTSAGFRAAEYVAYLLLLGLVAMDYRLAIPLVLGMSTLVKFVVYHRVFQSRPVPAGSRAAG